MSQKLLNITVNIAGRNYRMKVTPDEEAKVREAATSINQKIAEYRQSYDATDNQDYLAMAALLFTTELKRSQLTQNFTSSSIEKTLQSIERELNLMEQSLS